MTLNELQKILRAHRWSVRAHLLALLLLIIVQIMSYIRTTDVFDAWWCIGMLCAPVSALIYFRLKWKIEDHIGWIERMQKSGW